MTDLCYFDTDCLSSFLCINKEFILSNLYGGKIILPAQVYNEIIKVPQFINQIRSLKSSGVLTVESIMESSPEASVYQKLISGTFGTFKAIGKGEAAAISMAYCRKGILVSSNFRDIVAFAEELDIAYMGSADILAMALKKNLIDERCGNAIWREMRAHGRRLPYESFTDFLLN